LHGDTEENHYKAQDSQSPDKNLNPGLPEYKVGMLKHSAVTFGDVGVVLGFSAV
jgi:hypothetical protein